MTDSEPYGEKFNEPKREAPYNPTPVRRKKPNKTIKWLLRMSVLQVLLLAFIAYQFAGGGLGETVSIQGAAVAEPPKAAEQPSAPTPQPAPMVDMKTLADDDAVKGNPNAPVTIIEFSDFECSYCARFYSMTYKQLVEKYVDTGKVKVIYRDYPLSFHPNAQNAAEAAECAGEQGKYYEMHDKLFEESTRGGKESFKLFAQDLGLDTEAFNTCLDSGRMASEVRKDTVDGQRAGVRGTPAFFINGQALTGAQPFPAFEQIIEAELSG